MNNNNYDSIIIGSGIGGLTLVALLTHEAKQKVLILEKHSVPGGYACNFKRKGFTFDVSMHVVSGLTPGSIFWEILDECRITDKIEVIRPKALLRCVFPNEEIVIPECTLETYKRMLIQLAPHEERKISEIFDTLTKYHDEASALLGRKIPLLLEMLIFAFRYPTLIKYGQKTAADLLSTVGDQRVKDMISACWPWCGLPPSQLSMNYFAVPWTVFSRMGGYYVRGGGQALTDAFVASIAEGGSEVKLKTAVKKILVEEGKAVGVETESGERFFARNIISNANIPFTVFQLVGEGHFPERYINKIKSQTPSLSEFSVYLGLDTPIRELGINDYLVYLYPDYDFDALYASSVNGDFKNVLLALNLYSNIDKSLAPEGKGVMSITARSGYDIWKGLSGDEYQKKKKEVAQVLIERAEKIIPGLSRHIEVCEASTPLTLERYTGNYKGAIHGYAQTVKQSGLLNRIPQITPIKNLYFVGAWTFPGGGYTGVMQSAYELFRKYIR